MKTRERLKGLLRNFSLSLLCVGVANLSKSVAVVFQRGTHMTAISLTISLDQIFFLNWNYQCVLLSQCCKLFCEREVSLVRPSLDEWRQNLIYDIVLLQPWAPLRNLFFCWFQPPSDRFFDS